MKLAAQKWDARFSGSKSLRQEAHSLATSSHRSVPNGLTKVKSRAVFQAYPLSFSYCQDTRNALSGLESNPENRRSIYESSSRVKKIVSLLGG